uniref:Uncharacterized protein n=1 Tax=TTV-like virus DXL2 TaxID=167759 RepID=Q8V636_9VIRU|nr:unknown [TTV-like virus DXL2]
MLLQHSGSRSSFPPQSSNEREKVQKATYLPRPKDHDSGKKRTARRRRSPRRGRRRRRGSSSSESSESSESSTSNSSNSPYNSPRPKRTST